MSTPSLPTNVSISDLEDAVLRNNGKETSVVTGSELNQKTNTNGTTSTSATNANPSAGFKYYRPGSFIDGAVLEKYTKALLNESQRLMGQGNPDNVFQSFFTRLDRNGNIVVPLPALNAGYTFITRPRLNLSMANLMQDGLMSTLNSYNGKSVQFMIRALLDTKMCNGKGLSDYLGIPATDEDLLFHQNALNSPLIDTENPFLTPVCNALKGISGYPDYNIETETTEGDFHSGDFTFAKGSDMLKKTQELSLEFRDVKGSIVLSLFYYWIVYIALQTKGITMSYPDDIFEQRLNYTVSIYRFVMDTTRKNILWWSKATGCFPKSVPVGSIFNMSQDEVILSSATNFSIPFTAGKIEYNKPEILEDFNTLMLRYCPNIEKYEDLDYTIKGTKKYALDGKGIPVLREDGMKPSANLIGIPYIVSDSTGLRLSWRASAKDIKNNSTSKNLEELDKLRSEVLKNRTSNINSNDSVKRRISEVSSTNTSTVDLQSVSQLYSDDTGSYKDTINSSALPKTGISDGSSTTSATAKSSSRFI